MKAALWDMDDTVLNTLPARMRALAHAYETCLGSRTDPLALWRSHRGGTLEAMGQRLLGKDGPRFVREYRDFYYNDPHRAVAYEGIPDVLAACKQAGLSMGIVTSKISHGAIDELEDAGVLQYFGTVVAVDDTERHKPDAEPVFTALERLCIDEPEDAVFVGDSPADIFAARNAGCTSIAALWGALDEQLTLDASPVHTARTPQDVLRVIELRMAVQTA
ncbi:MAG: HAD family hydrolase [Hyphomicrobiales bacterium]